MKAIIIIICVTCSILWSAVNLSYANEMKVNDVNCTAFTDCNACIYGKCSYWFCGPKDKPNDSICASPGAAKPEAVCPSGKWIKLEIQSECYQNTTTTTTTTTTPQTTTTSTTSTTTPTPKTTTTESPNTTTQLTTKLTPTTHSSSTETPETDSDKHLSGWTISGIVILSVIVVAVIVGVAYKRVAKLYRSRNPYRNF